MFGTFTFCDQCGKSGPAPRAKSTYGVGEPCRPAGWYCVFRADGHGTYPEQTYDFCSLGCLQRWGGADAPRKTAVLFELGGIP